LTVRASFDIGKQAVRASPNVSPSEADKFLLLPEKDPHLVSLFSCLPLCLEWKRPDPFSLDHIPPPPEGFLGRNVEMYNVVSKVLRHRLVSICGPSGIGKTAISLAVANYISERRQFREGVVFVPMTDVRSSQAALREIALAIHFSPLVPVTEAAVLSALHRRHCLMIFDNPKVENEGIRKLLGRLLDHSRSLHLILTIPVPITARGALFGAGEKVVEAGPLAPLDAARLLLRRSPRPIDPFELSCKSNKDLVEKLASCLSSQSHYSHGSNLTYPGKMVTVAPLLQTYDLATFLRVTGGEDLPPSRGLTGKTTGPVIASVSTFHGHGSPGHSIHGVHGPGYGSTTKDSESDGDLEPQGRDKRPSRTHAPLSHPFIVVSSPSPPPQGRGERDDDREQDAEEEEENLDVEAIFAFDSYDHEIKGEGPTKEKRSKDAGRGSEVTSSVPSSQDMVHRSTQSRRHDPEDEDEEDEGVEGKEEEIGMSFGMKRESKFVSEERSDHTSSGVSSFTLSSERTPHLR
jgi:hypothetical protein